MKELKISEPKEQVPYKRHWSFVVTDKKYLYPFAAAVLVTGLIVALIRKEPIQFNRVGNFLIGIGVWISMRYTLREGINKHKNAMKSRPVLPGSGKAVQLNADYFNEITFSIGDAQLQIHGFVLVIVGSIVGSYGDLILASILTGYL